MPVHWQQVVFNVTSLILTLTFAIYLGCELLQGSCPLKKSLTHIPDIYEYHSDPWNDSLSKWKPNYFTPAITSYKNRILDSQHELSAIKLDSRPASFFLARADRGISGLNSSLCEAYRPFVSLARSNKLATMPELPFHSAERALTPAALLKGFLKHADFYARASIITSQDLLTESGKEIKNISRSLHQIALHSSHRPEAPLKIEEAHNKEITSLLELQQYARTVLDSVLVVKYRLTASIQTIAEYEHIIYEALFTAARSNPVEFQARVNHAWKHIVESIVTKEEMASMEKWYARFPPVDTKPKARH